MKIGIVLPSTPAYSETFFNSKIKGLQKHGYKVVLFTQSVRDNFNLCQVIKAPKVYKNNFFQIIALLFVFVKLIPNFKSVRKFIFLESQQNKSWFTCFKGIYINSHILSQQLDWLHFGFATMALGKENTAKSIGAKMAVSFRGYDINVYPLKFPNCYNLVWKKVDKVHSISKDLLDKAIILGLSNQTPHKIITPAIDINMFHTARNRTDFECEKVHILTNGRLHWVKGLDYSLRAMYLLKQQGIDFAYSIIGEGEQFEQLSFQIHQLNLTDCVHLLGKLSPEEVQKQLKEATIYLQYSVSEGFCNAVLEAQAMELLCIVSDAGALSENVIHNQTGWVVPKRSPEELAENIARVINLSLEEKNSIRNKAKNRVQKEFNLEKQQQEFINFYQES